MSPQQNDPERKELIEALHLDVGRRGEIRHLPAILERLTLKLNVDGREIEIPLSQINISYNGGPAAPQSAFFLCGNCGERIPRSRNPAENHHYAMMHAQVCGKRDQARTDLEALMNDFRQQTPAPPQFKPRGPRGILSRWLSRARR